MLASLLAGWGLSDRVAKVLAPIIIAAVIVAAFWLAMHFYGVRRYDQGVSAEDAKWQSAVTQLKADASNAATNADANKAVADANFVKQHSADQNAVTAAEAAGKSPLDALFGN